MLRDCYQELNKKTSDDMKKYIIIVHVYDEENSQAYPLGGLFGSSISADKYLHDHIEEVKNNHWTKGRSEDEDGYDEEFTAIGWTAQDIYSGQSIEIEIHYMEDEDFFEVCSVSKDDIEGQGFDASSLDEENMVCIASKMDDLIRDCCDYWTALEGACEYWDVPRKNDDDIREVIPGTEGMLNELSIRE